ncbi:hypothetical protein BRC86_12825 [Halobacteriales archaeon QS_3_64_16]|nr:MAG: hypothetical protein BRC86_12825 [Halobacteriales archaeon QS_3_64_16]
MLEGRGVLRRGERLARERCRVETDGRKSRFDRAGRKALIAITEDGEVRWPTARRLLDRDRRVAAAEVQLEGIDHFLRDTHDCRP